MNPCAFGLVMLPLGAALILGALLHRADRWADAGASNIETRDGGGRSHWVPGPPRTATDTTRHQPSPRRQPRPPSSALSLLAAFVPTSGEGRMALALLAAGVLLAAWSAWRFRRAGCPRLTGWWRP